MNYDKINQRIQALESGLVELKAGLAKLKTKLSKANSFKFDYIKMKTSFIGTYYIANDISGSGSSNLENFRYRQFESNADDDFQLQKELMCIGALAEQIDPNYKTKIDFTHRHSNKFMIFYDYPSETYTISSNSDWRALGVVYMPKDTAEKVCKILNNKLVKI